MPLNALYLIFQDEEDLVNAHRKQVEETMDIVREVCNEHEFCGNNALHLQHRELE